MTITAGYLSRLEVSADNTTFLIVNAKSFELNPTRANADTTHFETGSNMTHINTLFSWGATTTVEDDDTALDIFQDAMVDASFIYIRIYKDKTDTTRYWTGSTSVESITTSQNVEGVISYSITLKGTGALTKVAP